MNKSLASRLNEHDIPVTIKPLVVVPDDQPFVNYASTPKGTSLCAEASDLGFQPGRWPTPFRYQDQLFSISKGEKNRDGELVAVHYTGSKGATFVVFND